MNTIDLKLAMKRLADADEEYRRAKRDMEAIVRAEVKERIEKYKAKRDLLAFAAKQAGGSPTMIAREGLHTTNRSTAYEAIAAGEALSPDAPIVSIETGEVVAEFGWTNDGYLLVRPDAETLAPVLAALGLEPGDHSAIFELVGDRLQPITPLWTAETGRNPVAALVLGPNAEYRDRVLGWAAGKVAA